MVSALAFNVVAGFNDGGNLLAAAASSRTIPVPIAFALIVVGSFAGPLLFGTAVATTLGRGIADYSHVGMPLLLAAVTAALAAVLVSYAMRVPTSMSLALVSAMVGSLLVAGPPHAIMWSGVTKVVVSTLGSCVAGFLMGALVYAILIFLLRPVSRTLGDRIMRLQYGTVALQALGYGANDAEKMMGMIAAAGAGGVASQAFHVPLWAIVAAISAFAVGLAFGGMRVAKTVGGKLFTIRPQHALAFQAAAGATVMAASFAGAPLSTTETTASAVIGVGAAAKVRRVRWSVAAQIVFAWVITIPVAFASGALAGFVVRLFH